MNNDKYLSIAEHYEGCLLKYGDNHLGVDWPNLADALKRYQVMLDLVKPHAARKLSLLDFGCGASHFYEYLLSVNRFDITYLGLEISEAFYGLSKSKYGNNEYIFGDILKNPDLLPIVDYAVLNGVFTEKLSLTFEEMELFFKEIISRVFSRTQIGIGFNLMSTVVDWERPDLFHYPLDRLADFLSNNISRNFVIRNDYGLYEYSVYVYR